MVNLAHTPTKSETGEVELVDKPRCVKYGQEKFINRVSLKAIDLAPLAVA